MSRRVVVEVEEEVHRDLRKIAVINNLKLYVLVNAVLKDYVADEERLRGLLKKLSL